jgi:predicted aspartyl protease
MLDAMGILRTTIAIEHPARRGTRIELSDVIVDTGSDYTWVPRPILESLGLTPERVVEFVTADGRQIERGVGFANVYAVGSSTPDIVVFAERGDLVLLGARTLDGLNLRIDVVGRRLVDGGPVPAAVANLTSHRDQSVHPPAARLPDLGEHLGVGSTGGLEDVTAVIGPLEPMHRPVRAEALEDRLHEVAPA